MILFSVQKYGYLIDVFPVGLCLHLEERESNPEATPRSAVVAAIAYWCFQMIPEITIRNRQIREAHLVQIFRILILCRIEHNSRSLLANDVFNESLYRCEIGGRTSFER